MNRISIKKFAFRYSTFICILIACAIACTTKEAPVTEQPTALATIKTTLSPIVTPEPTEKPCPVYLGMQMDEISDAIGPYEELYWPDKEWGYVVGLHSFALRLADGKVLAVEAANGADTIVYGYYYYDTDGKLIKYEADLIHDMERIPVEADASFILQDHLLTYSQLVEAYGHPFPLGTSGWYYRYYTEDMCAIEITKGHSDEDPLERVIKIDLNTGEWVEHAFFEYYMYGKTIVHHYDTHQRLSAFDCVTGEQIAKVVYEQDGDTYRVLSAEGAEPIHTDFETLKKFKNFNQIKDAYGEPHFAFDIWHPWSAYSQEFPFENSLAYFTDNYGVAEVYLDESGNLAAVAYWNVNAEGEEEFEYYMY